VVDALAAIGGEVEALGAVALVAAAGVLAPAALAEPFAALVHIDAT
jgi:hypothetical protein